MLNDALWQRELCRLTGVLGATLDAPHRCLRCPAPWSIKTLSHQSWLGRCPPHMCCQRRTEVAVSHGVIAAVAHPAAREHSGQLRVRKRPPPRAELLRHLHRRQARNVTCLPSSAPPGSSRTSSAQHATSVLLVQERAGGESWWECMPWNRSILQAAPAAGRRFRGW